MIEQAIEAELNTVLAAHADEKTGEGQPGLARHGDLPERKEKTGIDRIPVKVPQVRGRGKTCEKIRFTPSILRPWLYPYRDFHGRLPEGLAVLLYPNAAGLPSTTISPLKADW